jgi:hypothetical protein
MGCEDESVGGAVPDGTRPVQLERTRWRSPGVALSATLGTTEPIALRGQGIRPGSPRSPRRQGNPGTDSPKGAR